MSPDLPPVDVFACSSTMGSLIRFVLGDDKPFRMLVEAVNGTVFFIRRENSPTELIPDVYGYGHSFPAAYTSWDSDVKGSTSHQRVLRYRFGGLDFLLRFESDGYIADPVGPKRTNTKASEQNSMDDLIDSLFTSKVSEAKQLPNAKLKIKTGGLEIVDQGQVFDLKTRSIKKKGQDTLGGELPRLWVAQIDKFILGHHTSGLFDDIEIATVSNKVKEWESDHKKDLAKLAALIHRIISQVRERPDHKLEVRRQAGRRALEVREQLAGVKSALSPEIEERWRLHVDSNGKKESSDSVEDLIVWSDDDDSGLDYTACSQSCSYCGLCSY
jgi:hypothetical protein